jgi:hypothetical protein
VIGGACDRRGVERRPRLELGIAAEYIGVSVHLGPRPRKIAGSWRVWRPHKASPYRSVPFKSYCVYSPTESTTLLLGKFSRSGIWLYLTELPSQPTAGDPPLQLLMLHKGRLLEALNRPVWASFDRLIKSTGQVSTEERPLPSKDRAQQRYSSQCSHSCPQVHSRSLDSLPRRSYMELAPSFRSMHRDLLAYLTTRHTPSKFQLPSCEINLIGPSFFHGAEGTHS